MEEPSYGGDSLTEEQLKSLSRNSKTLISDDGDIRATKATLEQVFNVSVQHNLTFTHRVAAWNTLCALVDKCALSENDGLRQLLWSDGLWDRLLKLYLTQSHHARPKSAKQVLSTLSSSWLKANNSHKDERVVASKLVAVLTDGNETRGYKAGLQAASYFLSRHVLSLDDILYCLPPQQDPSNAQRQYRFQELLSVLFTGLERGDVGSATGQLVAVLLDNDPSPQPAPGASGMELMPIWAPAIRDMFWTAETYPTVLGLHIFPILFERSVLDYLGFLQVCGFYQLATDDFRAVESAGTPFLYAALQCGKQLGILYETTDRIISHCSTHVSIPVHLIGRMLSSHSRSARLTGLSLLIISHSATRPFPAQTFRLLRRFTYIFMADTDANFRGVLFSLMQGLMDRLRAITATAQRQAHVSADAADTLSQSREFLRWLLHFLTSELRTTASYQHHICALRTLLIVARSGLDDTVPTTGLSKSATTGEAKWPFHQDILTPGLFQMLLQLLLDPFDDVRQTASAVLVLYIRGRDARWQHRPRGYLETTLSRAGSMIRTSGRADHADGVGLLFALYYLEQEDTSLAPQVKICPRRVIFANRVWNLEDALIHAEHDLVEATRHYPVHGSLTSLRYVLSQDGGQVDFDNIPSRLIECLRRVWAVVRPVLCDDAPEGHVPEQAGEHADISTKDTLSYCWRALKESSLLLGCLLSGKHITDDQAVSLSNLCFTQLAELRHRGAFSTVAQTWISCCIRCKGVKTDDGENLIDTWYNKIFSILRDGLIINTRRSAGLPSLVCGLLISDQSGLLVARTFEDLTVVARLPVAEVSTQESSLSQVHALNCIKDILKNTRLGEHSERYVSHALELAADSLRSDAWAVRNCGLMLFRAVIDRLLGTSDAHLDDDRTSANLISAQQNPELLDLVLELLHMSSAGDKRIEGIFPALQLLQSMDVPRTRRHEVESVVFSLTTSASWHIRDKAARVYAAIIDDGTTLDSVETVLDATSTNTNALHGALLCAKYDAVRVRRSSGTPPGRRSPEHHASYTSSRPALADMTETLARCSRLYYSATCPVIKAVCIDAVTENWQVRGSSLVAAGSLSSQQHASTSGSYLDVHSELQMVLNQGQCSAGEGILLHSLARATGLILASSVGPSHQNPEQTVALICSLGDRDADACATFLQNFTARHEPLEQATQAILIDACARMLGGSYQTLLKCNVQQFLLDLYDKQLPSEDIIRVFFEAVRSAPSPLRGGANQTYADQWLQLRAIAYDHELRLSESPVPVGEGVTRWTLSCCRAVQQSEISLYTRDAAALALHRVRPEFWERLYRQSSPCFMQLCFAVYDLLNDDDEDIRSLAANITDRITTSSDLVRRSAVLEPSEGRCSLLHFMVLRFGTDVAFAAEAYNRAFKVDLGDQGLSMDKQLDKLAISSDALFAEEKQNLYIDDAVEIKTWSQVLSRLDTSLLPQSALDRLAYGTNDGLKSLTSKAIKVDGALGWTTKPSVFTFGLQVIYGAEFLLHVVQRGRKLSVRPSSIVASLVKLAAKATETDINELWQREMRRVLDEAILRQLRLNAGLLGMVDEASRK